MSFSFDLNEKECHDSKFQQRRHRCQPTADEARALLNGTMAAGTKAWDTRLGMTSLTDLFAVVCEDQRLAANRGHIVFPFALLSPAHTSASVVLYQPHNLFCAFLNRLSIFR